MCDAYGPNSPRKLLIFRASCTKSHLNKRLLQQRQPSQLQQFLSLLLWDTSPFPSHLNITKCRKLFSTASIPLLHATLFSSVLRLPSSMHIGRLEDNGWVLQNTQRSSSTPQSLQLAAHPNSWVNLPHSPSWATKVSSAVITSAGKNQACSEYSLLEAQELFKIAFASEHYD